VVTSVGRRPCPRVRRKNQRSLAACRPGRAASTSNGVNRCTQLVDCHVIDSDAPFGQQLFHVTVGKPVAQISTHRHQDRIGGTRNPANPDLGTGSRTGRRRINPACPNLSSFDATVPPYCINSVVQRLLPSCAPIRGNLEPLIRLIDHTLRHRHRLLAWSAARPAPSQTPASVAPPPTPVRGHARATARPTPPTTRNSTHQDHLWHDLSAGCENATTINQWVSRKEKKW
jgi:hypothetical protein